MKIWYAYGSEHSMNLVMIGYFRNIKDAEKTQELIQELTEKLRDKIDIETLTTRYSDEVLDVLRETNLYDLSPSEFEHFHSPKTVELKDDRIVLEIAAMDASAFFKMMVNKSAKVEIHSTDDCSGEGGRSKVIGWFKSADDAEKAKQLIDKFTEKLGDKPDSVSRRERYNDAVLRVLSEIGCYILSPSELEHFLYDDNTTYRKENKIVLKTDESEVSAFFKLMIKYGEKVEVFSAHDHPYDE